MEYLLRDFRKPPLAFRGAPFWSWNDRLQVDELARQVRDMKAHGMGGFFMHSRDGLETVYMGPEWLECIRETVRVAKEEGMGAWLYDEDRWPSGAAGGLVPARGGDAFRAKVLAVEERAALPQDTSDVLALFAVTLHDGHLTALRRLREQSSLKSGEICLVFRCEVSGPSEWFNDDTSADNLNPDAVAAFIDITYEAYRKEVGHEFGKAVPGIFTDEPNIFRRRSPIGTTCFTLDKWLARLFSHATRVRSAGGCALVVLRWRRRSQSTARLLVHHQPTLHRSLLETVRQVV